MTKITSCATHVFKLNGNNNEMLIVGPPVKQNELVWTANETFKA